MNINNYLHSIGLNNNIVNATDDIIEQLNKRNKKLAIRFIKRNVIDINGKRKQIIEQPNNFFDIIEFQPEEEIQFHEQILKVSQNKNERMWTQNLFNNKKIAE